MTSVYQNSYVVAVLCFVLLSLFFYFFEFGYSTSVENGKTVKKFSWKYPLAISLIVWVVWHFYLYPPPKPIVRERIPEKIANSDTSPLVIKRKNTIDTQRILMENWN